MPFLPAGGKSALLSARVAPQDNSCVSDVLAKFFFNQSGGKTQTEETCQKRGKRAQLEAAMS